MIENLQAKYANKSKKCYQLRLELFFLIHLI